MSARSSKISTGAHSRREAMARGRRRGRVGGVVVDTRRKTEGGGGWVPWVEERGRVPSGGTLAEPGSALAALAHSAAVPQGYAVKQV